MARHRPLVNLLSEACRMAGVPAPELPAAPSPRLASDWPHPIASRVAEVLQADPVSVSTVRSALQTYCEAQDAIKAVEEAVSAGSALPAVDEVLAKVVPLENFHAVFSPSLKLVDILPSTRAPVATSPFAALTPGSYAPTRELDKLLRVEEGLTRMRVSLDRLWMQVKVLQTALDLTRDPDASPGTGRSAGVARALSRVLLENPPEAQAVRVFLKEFYAFQVQLQSEKTKLNRQKRVSRPQAPDLREIRAEFHKLGLGFHQLNGRPLIRDVFFSGGFEDAPETEPPAPAAPQAADRAEEYVERARATLAQLAPRRDVLALAYHTYLGTDSRSQVPDPTQAQVRSAEAIARCLDQNPQEARAVAGALERYEEARLLLEDFEAMVMAAEGAPPEKKVAILVTLDLDAFREKFDPLTNFGREFKGHPILGRIFPSPAEVFQASPGREPQQKGLFGGLIHKIKSATSPLIPPRPPEG